MWLALSLCALKPTSANLSSTFLSAPRFWYLSASACMRLQAHILLHAHTQAVSTPSWPHMDMLQSRPAGHSPPQSRGQATHRARTSRGTPTLSRRNMRCLSVLACIRWNRLLITDTQACAASAVGSHPPADHAASTALEGAIEAPACVAQCAVCGSSLYTGRWRALLRRSSRISKIPTRPCTHTGGANNPQPSTKPEWCEW